MSNSSYLAHAEALDYVVVTLIQLGGLSLVLGNSVILYHRKYPPIKAKGVAMTVLSTLGGLIWIVATLVVNGYFRRRLHSLLAVCALWTYWLQACFGFSLWLNCLTLRLIILYRIFIVKRGFKRSFIILLPLLLPAIIFCICGSVTHPIKYVLTEEDCRFQKRESPWAYGLISLLLLYFLIFLGFAFKLRDAVAQYAEFRLIRRGGVISLFLFLLSLVTIQTSTYKRPVGRCFLSAAVAITVFYYFWARNGEVIFNVLFHREEYKEKFLADLTRSFSQHERERFSHTFRNMENRLKEVRDEIQQHLDYIKQLEDDVHALELEYNSLQ